MVFEEEAYLQGNPDVREAVQHGYFQSGFQHFILYGLKENRLRWPKTDKPAILFSMSHNRNFFHKLGDVCIAHPTFNAIKEKFPAHNAYWITREELGELTSAESRIEDMSCDCQIIDGAPPNRFARDWLRSNRHPIDFIAQTAGVQLEPRHRYLDIPIPMESTKVVDALNLPSRYMVMAAGPCYSCRNWPLADRQKVVDLFNKRDVHCISLGGKDSAALRNTIDLCNALSLSQAIALIKRARLYIGPDTGTSWLACAARETPKVCVVDSNRLRDGIVGFQGFLLDRNIRDVVAQDGTDHCFDVAWDLWNGLEDDFDEEFYLCAHGDVANAVKSRQFSSGWEHYSRFGKSERRQSKP